MKKNIIVLLLLLLEALFLVGCVPKNEAEKHFNNVAAFLELQMFKEAMIELKNGLKLKEKDDDFSRQADKSILLASVYLYDKKTDKAKTILEEAVNKHKGDWNIHFMLATIYMNQKNYRKAAGIMEEVPLRIQDYGELDLMRGLRYLGENRYEEAEKWFRQAKDKFFAQALKFKEESGSSQFIKAGASMMINTLLGDVYDKEGKLPEALAAYEEASKNNPNSKILKTNVEVVKYKIALKQNPKDASLHNSLGWLYYQKGLVDSAISEYQLAVTNSPSCALAYNNLGLVYYDKKQYDMAIANFNRAVSLNNDSKASQYAYYNLGRTYRKVHNPRKALECLSKSLAINPQSLSVQREYKIAFLLNEKKIYYFELGNLYFENDEYQNAIFAYQKYLKANQERYRAYYNLGRCYLKLGELEKALVQFEKSIKANPEYWEAHYALGLTCAELENYKSAIKELNLALKNADKGKLFDVYNDLAYIYMENNDLASAVRYWKEAIKINDKKADKIKKILGVIG